MGAAVVSSAVGVQDTVLPYNKNFHLAFQHKNLSSPPPPPKKTEGADDCPFLLQ